MSKIISRITNPDISHYQSGYYSLNEKQIEKLVSMTEVIEQIRLRVFNEKIGFYSVALSHLLNELHGICYQIDNNINKSKDYDANKLVHFLQAQGISHQVCIGIRNLFDRRNVNLISHPGSKSSLAWSVSQDEYFRYHKIVSECLDGLIKSD